MVRRTATAHAPLDPIADILATGVVRLRLRDVRNMLIYRGKAENSLDGSTDKSVHHLEPQHGEERR